MVDLWTASALVYGFGVILALLLTDARPVARFGLALVWPLGPIAFLVTILVLLLVAAVRFPLFGAVALVAVAAYSFFAS
jgi:hypothetical protein